MRAIRKAGPRQPGQIRTPNHYERCSVSINEKDRRRISRSGEEDVLAALREAFSQRPDWRGFNAHQLSVLMFLHGYLSAFPEGPDVEAALPFALEDREGAA